MLLEEESEDEDSLDPWYDTAVTSSPDLADLVLAGTVAMYKCPIIVPLGVARWSR